MIVAAFRIFAFLTLITGIIYPLLITAIAQVSFPKESNGSFIKKDEKIVGSEIIGQKFVRPYHFYSRPSAIDYNPMPSGGSNLGPTSKDFKDQIDARRKSGLEDDLLLTSGSGLDPHISPKAADLQISRIVSALHASGANQERITQKVTNLVRNHVEERQFKIFGDPRVNVFRLNLALEDLIHQENLHP